MLARLHQAGAFQLAQRLAHRHARDAQAGGDIGLVDALAGLDLAAQDHAQHVVAHQLAQRGGADRGGQRLVGFGRGVPRQHIRNIVYDYIRFEDLRLAAEPRMAFQETLPERSDEDENEGLVLALTTMGVAGAASAQAEMNRCQQADGSIAFQQAPCRWLRW
jgi:hypothetical protein